MSIESARAWIIKCSLAATFGVFAFVLVAPAVGYPLSFSNGDAVRLMEILIPVFLGYLAAASHYVFQHKPVASGDRELPRNAVTLIKVPLLVFSAVVVIALAMFGFTNRVDARPGTGWSVDLLAGIMALALGLLTATTHVAVAYLFESDRPS